MLAEVVVIVVVVVVEVEFGTVGIETSVSWEQLWLLWHNFTLLYEAPPPEGTFWPRLPITLQALQFKAAAIRSQINMKVSAFTKTPIRS